MSAAIDIRGKKLLVQEDLRHQCKNDSSDPCGAWLHEFSAHVNIGPSASYQHPSQPQLLHARPEAQELKAQQTNKLRKGPVISVGTLHCVEYIVRSVSCRPDLPVPIAPH